MATPDFFIHGICNPITCNVGLHIGANVIPVCTKSGRATCGSNHKL